jgi:hypothetical protein
MMMMMMEEWDVDAVYGVSKRPRYSFCLLFFGVLIFISSHGTGEQEQSRVVTICTSSFSNN